MLVIGIDPASDGSACILHNDVVIVSIAWQRKRTTKKGLTKITHNTTISFFESNKIMTLQCDTGACIGAHIGASINLFKTNDEPIYIACEDAYVGKNNNTAIFVARFAGMIVGALHNYLNQNIPVHWIKPHTWQSAILKVSSKDKREQRKEKSLKYIPMFIPTAKNHLDNIGNFDHITDAIGIAMYATKYEI